MAGDVTFTQVSSDKHTASVLLEIPFLVIYIFCLRFYYNTFLSSNRMIN